VEIIKIGRKLLKPIIKNRRHRKLFPQANLATHSSRPHSQTKRIRAALIVWHLRLQNYLDQPLNLNQKYLSLMGLGNFHSSTKSLKGCQMGKQAPLLSKTSREYNHRK
jgi:hypothetical protein